MKREINIDLENLKTDISSVSQYQHVSAENQKV